MGGAASVVQASSWDSLRSKIPSIDKHSRLYTSLGLRPKDILRLLKTFHKIDKDNNGTISLYELLDFFQTTESDFVKKAFSVFDEDYNDRISFKEYVTTLWNYCTLNDISLPLFCFDIYDHTSTGSLELKEVMMLFHDFYGNDFMENKAVKGMLDLLGKAMKRKDEDSTIADLRLNVNEFKDFCHSHRMLLGPAYVFQLRMRKQICGEGFWKRCSKRRVVLSSGDDVKAADFLNSQTQYKTLKHSSFVVKKKKDKKLLESAGSLNVRRSRKGIETQSSYGTPQIVGRALNKIVGGMSPSMGKRKLRTNKQPRAKSKLSQAQKVYVAQ